MQLTPGMTLVEVGEGSEVWGAVYIAGKDTSEILAWDKEPDSRKVRLPAPTVVYLRIKWGKRVSLQGEKGRLLLIRVKFNILVFNPSTSSIWDPSRAGDIRANREGGLLLRS